MINVINRLQKLRGLPGAIWLDNGLEFTSKELNKWAYEHKVTLDFSRSGRPIDNAFVKRFYGSLRDECLNINLFLSLEELGRRSKPSVPNTTNGSYATLLTICRPGNTLRNNQVKIRFLYFWLAQFLDQAHTQLDFPYSRDGGKKLM